VNAAVRTNPARLDTDDDGMPDGFEVHYRLLPLAAVDARSDADEDSVSNVNEYRTGSSPRAVDSNYDGADDSDGDGLTNAFEDRAGISLVERARTATASLTPTTTSTATASTTSSSRSSRAAAGRAACAGRAKAAGRAAGYHQGTAVRRAAGPARKGASEAGD
jgi:hypothetical protein